MHTRCEQHFPNTKHPGCYGQIPPLCNLGACGEGRACPRSASLAFPASSQPSSLALASMPTTAPPPSTFTFSGGGGQRTAEDVHATLCALVTAEAAKHSAWADYAAVLLDEETAAFFAARLTDDSKAATDDGDESNPPSMKNENKKRKLADDGRAAEGDAVPGVICEHCGGAVPEISLRVACMDGTTLELTVAQRGLVREVKRVVGQVRLV